MKRNRDARAPFYLIPLTFVLCAALSAAALAAPPPKRVLGNGLVLPPIQRLAAEASEAAAGTAVQCVDMRTGTTFEYRAQHLLPSGAIDGNWVPDTAACCLGSPEGIREHVIPVGAGGAYAAWVDSRRDEPDIYLQRFTACGDTVPGWPLGGRAVCEARLSQYNLDACDDGAGGALLCWQDFRDGRNSAIYVQRMTAEGDPAPSWSAGGMAPAPGSREQAVPRLAPDGAGGALVFWQERDSVGLGLRVQRVTGVGTIAAGWPADGVMLVPGSQHVAGVSVRDDASGRVIVVWQCAADASGATLQLAGLDIGPVPGSDWAAAAITLASGAGMIGEAALLRGSDGGLLVGWSEMRAGESAVKLTRLTPGGSLSPGWPATGATVTTSGSSLSAPAVLPDGSGGAFVAWEDWWSTGSGEIYAQRVLGDGVPDSLWSAGGVPVAMGSVRLVVDVGTGEVVRRVGHDAYGRVVEDTNPGFMTLGYAGGITDPATGLVRFGARDYDPTTGRWTCRDPILFAGGSSNLWSYVHENPVGLIDPTGTAPQDDLDSIAGGADGLTCGWASRLRDRWFPYHAISSRSAAYRRGITEGREIAQSFALGLGGKLVASVAQELVALSRATPRVGSQKLQNIINDLYKGVANPNRAGSGTTADAIRHELATGQAVGGRFHFQKGTEYSRALENWLRANPNASNLDRAVAQSVLDDLRSALGARP